jgi:hypothetical protein
MATIIDPAEAIQDQNKIPRTYIFTCNLRSWSKEVELRTIRDVQAGPIAGKTTRYALSEAGQTLCFTRYWRIVTVQGR